MALNKLFALFLLIAMTSASNLSVKSDNFAKTIYKHLSEKGKNSVFSPVSLHAALGLAYQGAAGHTAEILSKYFPSPTSTSYEYKAMLMRLNAAEEVEIANKIYVRNDRQFKRKFENTARNYFQAEVESVDFRQNQDAANKINDWVTQKTHNKIRKLVSPNDFDEYTRAVLLNAIYFKADWASKFNKIETKTEKFYLDDTNTVDCPMMHQSGAYIMGENRDLNATLLKLKFRNERFGLLIILPNSKTGIEELEEKLSTTDLTTITAPIWGRTAEIYLPRFKIESLYDFAKPLAQIQLGDIYSEDAEFPDIVRHDNLTVSKIIQRATIEINEEGGEASAATGVILAIPISAHYEPPPPITFRADHPFMFLLTYDITDTSLFEYERESVILFMGKVVKPEIVH